MPNYQPQDIAALRAQGYTHSDFVCALTDQIRNYAIDSDARERQCQRRENAEKNHRQSPRSERAGDDFFHRSDVVDDLARVDFLDGAANEAHDRSGIALRAQHYGDGIRH